MESEKTRISLNAKGAAGEVMLAQLERVNVTFGPHHFVDILVEEGRIKFVVGATHHGFIADASEVWSQLERLVEEVRAAHPELKVN